MNWFLYHSDLRHERFNMDIVTSKNETLWHTQRVVKVSQYTLIATLNDTWKKKKKNPQLIHIARVVS